MYIDAVCWEVPNAEAIDAVRINSTRNGWGEDAGKGECVKKSGVSCAGRRGSTRLLARLGTMGVGGRRRRQGGRLNVHFGSRIERAVSALSILYSMQTNTMKAAAVTWNEFSCHTPSARK